MHFEPNQVWMLRHQPPPRWLSYVGKPTFKHSEPFGFLILDVDSEVYSLKGFRGMGKDNVGTVWNLHILTFDGLTAHIVVDESIWNFDGELLYV